MSLPGYRLRRATVDDLPSLLALWAAMNLPAGQLERRVTEFQIVELEDGTLLGALGMEIIGRHGRLHSEAFKDFSVADELRELLWARLQSVALSNGLARLWTDESAPFWKKNGFRPANAAAREKMAPALAAMRRDWLTLELRDEEALRLSLEKEFARIKEAELSRAGDPLRTARVLKFVAIGLTVILVAVIIGFCVYLLRHSSYFLRR